MASTFKQTLEGLSALKLKKSVFGLGMSETWYALSHLPYYIERRTKLTQMQQTNPGIPMVDGAFDLLPSAAHRQLAHHWLLVLRARLVMRPLAINFQKQPTEHLQPFQMSLARLSALYWHFSLQQNPTKALQDYNKNQTKAASLNEMKAFIRNQKFTEQETQTFAVLFTAGLIETTPELNKFPKSNVAILTTPNYKRPDLTPQAVWDDHQYLQNRRAAEQVLVEHHYAQLRQEAMAFTGDETEEDKKSLRWPQDQEEIENLAREKSEEALKSITRKFMTKQQESLVELNNVKQQIVNFIRQQETFDSHEAVKALQDFIHGPFIEEDGSTNYVSLVNVLLNLYPNLPRPDIALLDLTTEQIQSYDEKYIRRIIMEELYLHHKELGLDYPSHTFAKPGSPLYKLQKKSDSVPFHPLLKTANNERVFAEDDVPEDDSKYKDLILDELQLCHLLNLTKSHYPTVIKFGHKTNVLKNNRMIEFDALDLSATPPDEDQTNANSEQETFRYYASMRELLAKSYINRALDSYTKAKTNTTDHTFNYAKTMKQIAIELQLDNDDHWPRQTDFEDAMGFGKPNPVLIIPAEAGSPAQQMIVNNMATQLGLSSTSNFVRPISPSQLQKQQALQQRHVLKQNIFSEFRKRFMSRENEASITRLEKITNQLEHKHPNDLEKISQAQQYFEKVLHGQELAELHSQIDDEFSLVPYSLGFSLSSINPEQKNSHSTKYSKQLQSIRNLIYRGLHDPLVKKFHDERYAQLSFRKMLETFLSHLPAKDRAIISQMSTTDNDSPEQDNDLPEVEKKLFKQLSLLTKKETKQFSAEDYSSLYQNLISAYAQRKQAEKRKKPTTETTTDSDEIILSTGEKIQTTLGISRHQTKLSALKTLKHFMENTRAKAIRTGTIQQSEQRLFDTLIGKSISERKIKYSGKLFTWLNNYSSIGVKRVSKLLRGKQGATLGYRASANTQAAKDLMNHIQATAETKLPTNEKLIELTTFICNRLILGVRIVDEVPLKRGSLTKQLHQVLDQVEALTAYDEYLQEQIQATIAVAKLNEFAIEVEESLSHMKTLMSGKHHKEYLKPIIESAKALQQAARTVIEDNKSANADAAGKNLLSVYQRLTGELLNVQSQLSGEDLLTIKLSKALQVTGVKFDLFDFKQANAAIAKLVPNLNKRMYLEKAKQFHSQLKQELNALIEQYHRESSNRSSSREALALQSWLADQNKQLQHEDTISGRKYIIDILNKMIQVYNNQVNARTHGSEFSKGLLQIIELYKRKLSPKKQASLVDVQTESLAPKNKSKPRNPVVIEDEEVITTPQQNSEPISEEIRRETYRARGLKI